ncbi:MAG: DUF559 domain-containing protein [Bacteroidales bacterium]|nr:DUF559 domain-containing protein [Bacteroidales bacterium]
MTTKRDIIQLARDLRKRQTPSEKLLWENLRNRKLKGKKFNRQFPIVYDETGFKLHFFIADFYCDEAKLVIELDGKIHEEQEEYDKTRDSIMGQLGLKVLRFKNEEL